MFRWAGSLGLAVGIAALLPGQVPVGPKTPEPPAVPAKTDWDLIQGTWQIVGLEAHGRPEPARNYQSNQIIFIKDRVILREWGYPPLEFTFTLDANRTPKTIDLTGKGVVVRGIYTLNGDDLTLSVGLGGMRPAEFVTRPGSDSETFYLKRSRWERYSHRTLGVSVELPVEPELRGRPEPAAAQAWVAVSRPERVTYVVTVSPLATRPTGKDWVAASEAAVRGAVAEADPSASAEVEAELPFKGGSGGRELLLTLDTPGTKDKLAARARVFASSDRLVVLAVIGTEESVRSPNVTRFWASFRWLGERKN